MGLREEEKCYQDFPGGSVVKSLAANSGDAVSIPDVGRFHMSWSSEAHLPKPLSQGSKRTHVSQLLKLSALEPVCPKKRHRSEEACTTRKGRPLLCNQRKPARSNEDPAQTKTN